MKYNKVNISLLEEDNTYRYDIYIKIQKKFILYIKKENFNESTLLEMKQRGFSDLYLNNDDYSLYQERFNIERLETSIYKKQQLKYLTELVENKHLFKNLFTNIGFDSSKIKQLERNVNTTINMLKTEHNLITMYNLLKNVDDIIFIKKNLILFLIINILNKSNKINRTLISKITTAVLIFDSTLSFDEYWESFSKTKNSSLSETIKFHPHNITKKLPEDFFPPFIFEFIKDHHESPDGKGFPKRKTAQQINYITALYIVIEDFISLFINEGFNKTRIQKILHVITRKYNPYINSDFIKVVNQLNKLIKEVYND